MFQFRRFPTYTYLIQCTLTEYCSARFPHSEISGSTVICTSPKLIAACHVLHRLLMPRHSPCALISLTSYFLLKKKVGKENFNPSFLSQESMSLIWFSEFELCRLQIQQNYCFTLLAIKKVPQLRLFPSVACSSYFGYFVQFSRCGSGFVETRFKHSLEQMLESKLNVI